MKCKEKQPGYRSTVFYLDQNLIAFSGKWKFWNLGLPESNLCCFLKLRWFLCSRNEIELSKGHRILLAIIGTHLLLLGATVKTNIRLTVKLNTFFFISKFEWKFCILVKSWTQYQGLYNFNTLSTKLAIFLYLVCLDHKYGWEETPKVLKLVAYFVIFHAQANIYIWL